MPRRYAARVPSCQPSHPSPARVVIAMVLLVMSVVPIALAAAPQKQQQVFRCHRVLVQYENAPHIPIEARDVCEWRER